MRSQAGFTLSEVGMAIGISTVVAALAAGAGFKLNNDSKAQALATRAQEVAAAVDMWMNREGTSLRGPKSCQGCGGDDILQLAKYLPNGTIFNANPWTNSTLSTLSYYSTADDNYAFAGAFNSGGYPMDGQLGRQDCRAMILVLTKEFPTFNKLRVWDNTGASYKTFSFYAVQAIDNRGYPAITVGK